jgi:nitrite reductase (NADH) small subunit
MAKWTNIGTVDDIPPLGTRVVTTSNGNIAIFRTRDDRIFALADRCPHRGGPLSQGIVHGKRVTCPLHNLVIELENGRAVAPDTGCAKAYPVRVIDGAIQIALEITRQPAAARAGADFTKRRRFLPA